MKDEMRFGTLFDNLISLDGSAFVQWPVRCGICGKKSRGIPLLFWYLPCEEGHYKRGEIYENPQET